MKQSLIILFLMFAFAGYSQGKLTYGSGGTVYNAENQKVNTNLVRALMDTNPEALKLYNAGRSKKTWGNVLFYGGIGLVATNMIVAMNNNDITSTTKTTYDNHGNPLVSVVSASSERSNMTLAVIGGAMFVASIPIKIGYPKKIKAALEKYNAGLADTYKPEPKTTLIASVNQIGLRIEF